MSIDVYPARQAATPAAVLAYAPKSGHQTGITSEAAVTELVASVFLRPQRTYRVTAFLNMVTSVNDQGGQARLKMDGVEIQFSEIGTARGRFTLSPERVLAPGQYTPGQHVFTVTAMKTGATNAVDVNSWTTDPSYLIVEDITGGTGGPGPILLDHKQLTTTQAGITGTLVDVTNLSSTVNVPAGRALRVTSKMQVLCTGVTGDIYIPILEDGAVRGRVTYRTLTLDQYMNPMGSIIVYPTPGVHTYKVQAAKWSGGGGMEVRPATDNPAYLTVEDVTGTEAPTGAYYEALWTPVTSFLNGWVAYDASMYYAPAYRKVNDMVYLRGLIKSGTANTAAFNLPPGYRPNRNHHQAIAQNDATGFVEVSGGFFFPAGDVKLRSVGAPTWASLDGVVFGVT